MSRSEEPTQSGQENRTTQDQEILELCRQLSRFARVKRFALGVSIPVTVAINLLPLMNSGRIAPIIPMIIIILYFYIIITVLCFAQSRYLSVKPALEKLKRMQDVRSVGALINALTIPDQRDSIKEVLTRLLPRLQASDAHLLSVPQQKLLCQALKQSALPKFTLWPNTERTFALAVLTALQQVGTEEAIPAVEYVAQTAREAEVRLAAQTTLPYLRTRAEQQHNEQTLLRASAINETVAAELLRPASEQTETPPQQLLRAVE